MTFRIGDTHDSIHPVDLTRFARVVPSVLRPRKSVVVEQDSDTVLPCPRDRSGEVPICQSISDPR